MIEGLIRFLSALDFALKQPDAAELQLDEIKREESSAGSNTDIVLSQVHRVLERDATVVRAVSFWLSIIGLLIVGLGEIGSNFLSNELKGLAGWFWVIGIFLSGFGLFISHKIRDTSADITSAAIDLRRQYYSLKNELNNREDDVFTLSLEAERLEKRYGLLKGLANVLDATLAQNTAKRPKQSTAIKFMVEMLLDDKGALLGIDVDEQWGVAVYLWDTKNEELRCVHCRRWNPHLEEQEHRIWKPGEGHVGKAFQSTEDVICSDTSAPDVRGFFDAPPEKRKEDDTELYRSIASIPILSGADDTTPFGVLVANSNVAGRFSADPASEGNLGVEPLQALADILANVLASTHRDD